MANEWALMTWQEVRDAEKTQPVVLVPIGCVETQGPYTPVGFEFAMADRLAKDVAARTNGLAIPALPFGNSDTFEPLAGTVLVRPRVLVELYKDVLMSLHRSGFRKILCLAFHVPNQPLIEEAARYVRKETGMRITWVNPGALAGVFFREFFADPGAVRGHGAEPGSSLARYIYGTDIPADAGSGEKPPSTYQGLDVKGAGLQFKDFPVGTPYTWDELYPKSGGFGDPTQGSAEIGQKLYERIVGYLADLVRVVEANEVDAAPPSGEHRATVAERARKA
jgi:creatinine amidohydrolase